MKRDDKSLGEGKTRKARTKTPAWQRVMAKSVPGQGPTGDCIFWTGATYRAVKGGHGCVRGDDGRLTQPHRVMFEFDRGVTLPKDVCILHICDQPTCVNPRHLTTGKQRENMDDKVAKGRAASKLTAEEAVEIYGLAIAGNETQAVIAKRYGVSAATVSAIKLGRSWGHATGLGRKVITLVERDNIINFRRHKEARMRKQREARATA